MYRAAVVPLFTAGTALILVLMWASPGMAQAPQPVWDTTEPFLALVLGIVDSSWQGRVSGTELQRAIGETGKKSKLPIQGITFMSRRERSDNSPAQWVVTFQRPQHLAVPYSILGYHPGSIETSRSFILEEWKLGSFVFSYSHQGKTKRSALRDVTLWAIHPGTVFMDIDGFVDALLGAKLDDTHIVGFALFRDGEERYLAALGYNKEGRGASGVFHLNRDRIMFPYPARLKRASRLLRTRLEQLAPEAVAPYRNIKH